MNNSSGTSVATVIFIVLLILKLANVIDWSWWWVTAPLWMPIMIMVVLYIILLPIAAMINFIKKYRS